MNCARALTVGLALAAGVLCADGAGPVPVIFRSAPGQFEVAAVDATAAQAVVAQAEEGWRWLAGSLALPEAFSSPVFVRLVPAAGWTETEKFRVVAEAGGVVSVRMSWSESLLESTIRRALVRALLMRAAVARHGANERIAAPRWLEEACLGWWRTHADGAQLDALKQEAADVAPPALADLLGWRRDATESPSLAAGSTWLLAFLQEDGGRTDAWSALLNRLLGGEAFGPALAASFPGRFANDGERELWWQTGWHYLRRVRTLPTLGVSESRAALAELARFVFTTDGHEAVEPLRVVLAHGAEPAAGEELQHRIMALSRLLPSLHPFYRNAGLALAEALGARAASTTQRGALCVAFESEWRAATELEVATTAALDALEKR